MATPTPTPSSSATLAERIVATARAPDHTKEQWMQLLGEIHATNATEKPKILETLKANLKGLDTRERALIQQNLQELNRRMQTELTAEDLNQLRSVTEVMRTQLANAPTPPSAPPLAAEAPAAAITPPTPTKGAVGKKWYKPQTWTKEERKHAAMYAGTGVVVVGGLLLARWMWNGIKKKANQAGNAVKKGWSWLKWGALAGVLTAGGYFGIKAAKDQIEKMGLRKLQEEWMKVQEQAKNIQHFTAQQYEAWKQKRAELEEKMQAYGAKPTEDTTSPTAPVAPTVAQQARETGAEVVQFGTEQAIASSLARFFPSPDWARVHGDKKKTIYGIMQHPDNATLTVAEIIAGTRAFAVGEENAVTEVDNRHATQILRTLCISQRPKLIERLMKRDHLTQEAATAHVNDMPFVPFLKQVAMVYAHAEQAADILQRAYENPAAIADLAQLGALQDLSEDLKMQLRSFMDKNIAMTEEEKAKITTESLVKLALASGGIYLRAYAQPPTTAPAEARALHRFVMEEAASPETAKCMLPFFHKVFLDPDVWSETNMAHNLNIVTTYMQDWMTVDEILRIYLYRKMIEAGNPAGVVLMQAAILKYVTVREYGDNLIGLKTRKYDMIQRIGKKCTDSGMQEFQEEWRKLEMNPKLLEEAQEILGNVLTVAGKSGLAALAASAQETGSAILSGAMENPKFSIPAGLVTAGGIYRYYAWMENYTPGNIHITMGKSGTDWLKTAILHGTSTKQYQIIYKNFDTIFNAAKGDITLMKQLENCCKSQGGKATWEVFFKMLNAKVPPVDPKAIKAAEYFTKFQLGRDVIANTRMMWNSIPFVKPVTRAIGSVKNGVVTAARNTVGRIPVPAPLAKVAGLVKGAVVLDTALVGYEMYDYFLNERPRLLNEIEHENDPAKKAQLERELKFNKSASLVFNATGTALLYSPAMPIGVAMLAGNAARQAVSDSIEAGTTYMLKTEKELEQESAGQILQHIGQTSPGQFATWGQGLAANPAKYVRNPALAGMPDPAVRLIAPDMSHTFDKANEGARKEGYRAYFRQAAQMVLPPFTTAELSEANQKLPPTEINAILAKRAQDELGYFATAALTYLKEVTHGSFTLADPVILRKAELYARSCTLVHRQDLSHPEKAQQDHRTWAEKQAETDKNYAVVEIMQATDIASLSSHPSIFAQQAVWKLLLAVRHELAACETKILTTDYSNWLNIKSYSWIPGTGHGEESLRAIARGAYAERMARVVRNLINTVQKGETVTPEQIIQTIAAMRLALVEGNPNDIAFESMNQKRDASYGILGNNVHLLSYDTMWKYIQETLPAAPAVTPARPPVPPAAASTVHATAA